MPAHYAEDNQASSFPSRWRVDLRAYPSHLIRAPVVCRQCHLRQQLASVCCQLCDGSTSRPSSCTGSRSTVDAESCRIVECYLFEFRCRIGLEPWAPWHQHWVRGADINLVEIVEKRGEIEVEEFIFDLPPTRTVEELVAACDCLESVRVEWVRNYPRGGGIEYDIELHRRIAADPSRAGEILASAAPLVFRAQWSVLLDVSAAPQVTFATPGAPDLDAAQLRRFDPFDMLHRVALEPDWIPGTDAHHAVVSPIADQRAVIVARRGEPPFFGSELARLAHVTGATATTDMFDQPQSTTDPQTAHRTPVATPLYERRHP